MIMTMNDIIIDIIIYNILLKRKRKKNLKKKVVTFQFIN